MGKIVFCDMCRSKLQKLDGEPTKSSWNKLVISSVVIYAKSKDVTNIDKDICPSCTDELLSWMKRKFDYETMNVIPESP